ncbi:MAG: hypothetical protein HY366_01190 [Candidatus Aenigmarchaeota archaeon]|nr:hypothetical protein [Candidatus Aenigmarchaeota archaeon]
MRQIYYFAVSIFLAAVGLMAAFNTIGGFITIAKGVTITLLSIGVLVLLNIQARLEELVEAEKG